MADYTLEGLSTRSFEQLVQAIAAKLIGPNVVIFGDGRDGGREATFEGHISYPSKEEGWSGYGVVQAKFKQRTQDTKTDGDWALQQLRQELADFNDPAKARKKPDYYIFATNVILTPFPDKGSKDRVASLFEEFSDTVPLKGYDVWDYDKIRVFLDDNEDIRRGYSAWITPGDVLSQVIEWIRPKMPDFEQTLSRYLQEDLAADQYANLEKARHASDNPIPIARVFVDMPVFDEQVADPPEESEDKLSPGFIAEVLDVAAERLDPKSQTMRPAETQSVAESSQRIESGRFVLIGGPGQGKTTVGQFVCQLFRASILKDKPASSFEPDVVQALKVITSQVEGESFRLPSARRFPIRIVLSEFAKALASKDSGQVNSLLTYVVDRIRKKTNREVSLEDFRRWLSAYPWLLVLDGLDEVPASSNRDEVLDAIRSFRIEARECNADLLIIATTRPQGYNQDFNPGLFKHKYLAPLSMARALRYGCRLVEARYAGDDDRRERIISRLKRASEQPATSRLMRSPLQVTIMTTLVDRMGQPPQERWDLFRKYYNVIYEREVEREIPILREYKTDIDVIHKRVGLLLQVESERPGQTEARLSSDDFGTIVEGRLKEKEHQGEEGERLKSDIIKAAAERLVFLVGLEADQVGFEIRSLQEFMAAEGLMDGSDQDVRNRLREIAPISNWRNVFLFAAGKCLVEREHLLDTIHTICAELNDAPDDTVAQTTMAGSQLALDLLEDMPVKQQPRDARILARIAMRLLDLPPNDQQSRLANLYDPVLESIYQSELSSRMERGESPQSLGAWTCLLRLIQMKIEWAVEMGETRWPSATSMRLDLLKTNAAVTDNPWLQSKFIEALPRLPLLQLFKTFMFKFPPVLSAGLENFPSPVEGLESFFSFRKRKKVQIHTSRGEEQVFELLYQPLSIAESGESVRFRDTSNFVTDWTPLIAAARFTESPSRETLARELRNIAHTQQPETKFWVAYVAYDAPWPLGGCISVATNGDELLNFAQRVEAGELGDVEDWRAAEQRWQSSGITFEDIEYMTDERWPFDKLIAEKGFPMGISGWSMLYPHKMKSTLAQLYEMYRHLDKSKRRSTVAAWIMSMISEGRYDEGRTIRLTLEEIKQVTGDIIQANYLLNLEALTLAWANAEDSAEWMDFLDHFGRYPWISSHANASTLLPNLVREFSSRPHRMGILRLISFLMETEDALSIPPPALDLGQMQDLMFKEAAIVIRLAQSDLSADEAKAIASHAGPLLNEQNEYRGRLRSFLPHLQPAPWLDVFLVELSKILPPSRWEVSVDVLNGLNDSLRRRESKIRVPDVWSELNLPKGLRILLH